MIKVIGRKLQMTQKEKSIGFEKDNLAEKREFLISDARLAGFSFRLDVEKPECIIDLEKKMLDDGSAVLTWDIGSGITPEAGILTVQLRALDPNSETVWHSERTTFYIGKSIDAVSAYADADLSGFEQIEQRALAAKELALEYANSAKGYSDLSSESSESAAAYAEQAKAQALEARNYADDTAEVAMRVEPALESVNAHMENTQNPHGVTAEQTGAYDKATVDKKVNNCLQTDGSNHMQGNLHMGQHQIYYCRGISLEPEDGRDSPHIGSTTGKLRMDGAELMNVGSPTQPNSAVTRGYLEGYLEETAYDKATVDEKITAARTEALDRSGEIESALSAHEMNTENPHGVTAEQTGAYDKSAIDKKLVLAGVDVIPVDLTTCTIVGTHNPEFQSYQVKPNSLSGDGILFTVNVDSSRTYELKGVSESLGYIEINGSKIFNYFSSSPVLPVDFEYVGEINSMEIYLSAGDCNFEYFNALIPRDGFISSSDKKKLDGLPNDVYSKSETDSKISDIEAAVDEKITAARTEAADRFGDIDAALDGILEIQNSLVGGETA